MIGRRRIKENEKIDLYVCQKKLSYYKKHKYRCFETFNDAYEIIGANTNTIEKAILKGKISWDSTVSKFIYDNEEGRKQFSWLSYYLHSEQYLQLKNLIQKMETDPDSYLKQVCTWLNKEYDESMKLCNSISLDKENKQVAELLKNKPDFLTKDSYKELGKKICSILNRKEVTKIDSINKILKSNDSTSMYSIESFNLKSDTFYLIYKDTNKTFPYKFNINLNLSKQEDFSKFLEEKHEQDANKLFNIFFNKDMPEIFKNNEKFKVSFLSFCLKKIETFKNISLRRSTNGIRLYGSNKQ